MRRVLLQGYAIARYVTRIYDPIDRKDYYLKTGLFFDSRDISNAQNVMIFKTKEEAMFVLDTIPSTEGEPVVEEYKDFTYISEAKFIIEGTKDGST